MESTATRIAWTAAVRGRAGIPREEVMRRIEALAAQFLHSLSSGALMDMEALRRDAAALAFDPEQQRLLHGNAKRLIRLSRNGARKYTAVWIVLQTAYALLSEQKTVSQREIYYLHPFFKAQHEADEAILDAGSILGVPRTCLNIVGATKGSFAGRISVQKCGEWTHCGTGEEQPITQQLLELERHELISDAQFILIVEKDGIFGRLREDRFFDALPSILVTGKGFPDLATRAFVSFLSRALGLPVIGLCDCNPFGASIMMTYKLGSARMPLETQSCTADVKWLGLRPSQIPALGLPSNAFKPLTQKDISAGNALMRSPFVQANQSYLDEISTWTDSSFPWKIELEALHALGFSFLTAFIRQSILDGSYL